MIILLLNQTVHNNKKRDVIIKIEYLFKIILVGSETANKTALIKRYAEGTIRPTYNIGADFFV